jgi:hypothetical protein
MFRLIKLAMLALFGYAVYEFFRGMLQDTQLGSRMNEAFGQLTGQGQQGGGGGGAGGGSSGKPGQYQMSGGGQGAEEATLERDGGSVRHKVGRGVIS